MNLPDLLTVATPPKKGTPPVSGPAPAGGEGDAFGAVFGQSEATTVPEADGAVAPDAAQALTRIATESADADTASAAEAATTTGQQGKTRPPVSASAEGDLTAFVPDADGQGANRADMPGSEAGSGKAADAPATGARVAASPETAVQPKATTPTTETVQVTPAVKGEAAAQPQGAPSEVANGREARPPLQPNGKADGVPADPTPAMRSETATAESPAKVVASQQAAPIGAVAAKSVEPETRREAQASKGRAAPPADAGPVQTPTRGQNIVKADGTSAAATVAAETSPRTEGRDISAARDENPSRLTSKAASEEADAKPADPIARSERTPRATGAADAPQPTRMERSFVLRPLGEGATPGLHGNPQPTTTQATELANALSTPAQKQAAQLVERTIAPQITAAMTTRPNGGVIDLMLDPPDLGRIEILLELGEQGLRATLNAERPGTGDLMRRHADTLMQQFEDAGFSDVDLSFGDGTDQDARSGEDGQTVGLHSRDQFAATAHPAQNRRSIHASDGRIDIRL